MYYDICSCTTLKYPELWECKKNIKSKEVHQKLRELANPICPRCKGDGKIKV